MTTVGGSQGLNFWTVLKVKLYYLNSKYLLCQSCAIALNNLGFTENIVLSSERLTAIALSATNQLYNCTSFFSL